MFITYSTIFGTISTLRLEQALLIPEDEEEVDNLVATSLKTLFVGSFLIFILLTFFYTIIFSGLTALGSFLLGFGTISIQYFNRMKNSSNIIYHKSMIGPLTSIAQLLLQFSKQGLVFGKILGDVLSMIPYYKRNYISILKKKVDILRLVSKHRNFPAINLPHSLFTTISNKAPLLLFGYLGLENLSGEFEMVVRIGLAPITVITSSFYLIFSERFSEKARNKQLITRLLRSNLIFIGLVFGLPIVLFSFFAPQVLPLILGEKWLNTGTFFQLLLPLMIATLMTSPFVYIFQFFDKQWLSFKLELLNSFLKLAGLFIGLQFSPNYGLLFFALGAAVGYTLFMINIYVVCKHFDNSIK